MGCEVNGKIGKEREKRGPEGHRQSPGTSVANGCHHATLSMSPRTGSDIHFREIPSAISTGPVVSGADFALKGLHAKCFKNVPSAASRPSRRFPCLAHLVPLPLETGRSHSWGTSNLWREDVEPGAVSQDQRFEEAENHRSVRIWRGPQARAGEGSHCPKPVPRRGCPRPCVTSLRHPLRLHAPVGAGVGPEPAGAAWMGRRPAVRTGDNAGGRARRRRRRRGAGAPGTSEAPTASPSTSAQAPPARPPFQVAAAVAGLGPARRSSREAHSAQGRARSARATRRAPAVTAAV